MTDQPDSHTPAGPLGAEPLTSGEARVLGCLIEKQATTPESYPLTLNAVVLACNQKTSREPLMSLTPGQVGQSLRSLEGRGLSRLVMGSRADRWEQRCEKALELVPAQVILTGLQLLRGPQTLNELLTRSQRMQTMLERQAKNKWGDTSRWMELSTKLPFGRMAEPDEIARMTAFACSPLSGYLSGTVINLDAGQIYADPV